MFPEILKLTRKNPMKIKLLFIYFVLFINISVFSENITFSAGKMKGIVGSTSDSTELSENAYVLTETMEISADSIKMSGDNFRYIEAAGSIKGKNIESKMEFTCDNLKYDRETKIAELKNNVSLTDTENDVSAKAQVIEYNQELEIAVMQIDIELKQKDNICSGAYAVYRKNEKMLDLSGNAQIKQKEDTFRAMQITLNMDTQEISLDGRVKGSIIDERKSEKTENNKTEESTETEKTENSESSTENTENVEKKSENTENQQTETNSSENSETEKKE